MNLIDNWKFSIFGAFVPHFLNSYSDYLYQIVKTIPQDKGNSDEYLQKAIAGKVALEQPNKRRLPHQCRSARNREIQNRVNV